MAEKDTYFVAVKLFLEGDKGEFLISKDIFGDWDIPGGRLLPDEFHTPFEKVIARKIKKELGSDVKYELLDSPPILIRHERVEFELKKKVHIFALGYRAKYLGGKINLWKIHSEYKWVPINNFEPEKYFTGGWLEGVKAYQKIMNSSNSIPKS
jgi:hypothetical protein